MARWRWQPVVFFAFLAFLVIAKPLFQGHTIGAFDQIHQMAPWNGPKPNQPWDVLQADSVLQFYPWRDLVFESWHKGQLPLWNNFQLCGTPLLANSQSAGFYPPHILLGLLGVPTGLAILLLAWFHLFWASLGAYSLSRRIGASRLGGIVAGISFGGSTFMLSWLALPSVVSTAAWVPWILSLGLGLYTGSTRQAVRQTAMLAFAIGMMFLAGHLQIAAYGMIAFVVAMLSMSALKLKSNLAWSRGSLGVAAAVIGFALASPQLLPAMQYSKLSHRQNTPSERGYDMYVAAAIPPSEFFGRLANPFSFGVPTVSADAEEQVTSYWPAFSRMRQGGNFAESASTVGPVVLALLLMVAAGAAINWLRQRKPEEDEFEIDWPKHYPLISLGIVGVLALLLAVGTPLNAALYYWVPGWSASGSPGRVVFLFVLACCAVSGLAVRDYENLSMRVRGLIALGAFILIAGTVSIAISASRIAPDGINPETWTILTSVSGSWNRILVLVAPLVGVGALFALRPKFSGIIATIAFVPALALVGAGIVRSGDPSFLTKPAEPNYGRHAYINEAWDPLNAVNGFMPPNTASAMRVHDVAGYDSLISKQSVEWLKDVLGQDPAPPANGNIMFVKPSADSAKLTEGGVSSLDQVGQDTLGLLTKGRAYTPQGPARFVEEGYDRLILKAKGPGKLVVADANLPGWTAKVDGKTAAIGGSQWREVELPDGDHTVAFKYVPPGFVAGTVIGCFGFVAAAVLGFLFRRQKDEV